MTFYDKVGSEMLVEQIAYASRSAERESERLTPAFRNSISNRRSAIGPGCRIN
jgi:hypothetical protein